MRRNKLPAQLKEWRKSKGITQREAAEVLGFGKLPSSQVRYARYEAGTRKPEGETVKTIYLITGIDCSELAGFR